MTIEQLWERYQRGAFPGSPGDVEALEISEGDPGATFYGAVLCYASGAVGHSARLAQAAAQQAPSSRVYREAARYLAGVADRGRPDVYVSPEGFAAFVRGGSNVGLYEALRKALTARYQRYRPETLLDIGTGDGHALLPALTTDVGHVDVLEPSRAMLATTAAALRHRGVSHRDFHITLEQLAGGDAARPISGWSLAQATFALHTVPPAAREEALGWLGTRTDRLLVAEFDVRPGHSCEPEWFRYVVSRYERGLAEYEGDGGLVAQGFLLPVMFGYVDPAVSHHEQPIESWIADLRAAGFPDVHEPVLLYDYWWAPAYLLETG